ncbi:MAG: Xaa-Pro aminopeptidase [Cellvibrionaceae bacterium]
MSISKQEFARRRKTLMELMEPDSIAIVPSAAVKVRNRDADFLFRQDSDFFYLTGFNEPEAVLVLVPGREHGETVMFVREKDIEKETWDGYISGPEGVCRDHGADDAFPIDDIDDILPGLIEGTERVYYAMGKNPGFDQNVMNWVNAIRAKVRAGATPPGEFSDLDHFLHDMRLFKSAAEIRIMKKAGEISANAHARAMQVCQPGMYEYQIEAEMKHEFGMNGAPNVAYNPIVGGGDNACILHYVENNQKLKSGDLLLIDAGCELENYASDITRTFPVNGKFSTEQKALYEITLAAQTAAMKVITPNHHWNDPHEESVKVITSGLVDLGLLKGDVDELIKTEAYRRFYMHRVGHWLGMDVHDVGDYKVGGEWRVLEPGMVMTVEPGIYVSPNDETVDEKWRGIGIRIEDDVLVTKGECEILSVGVPRTVDEIEALMAS